MKLPQPAQPQAVVFSLAALCTYDGADRLAALAFRAMVDRFGVSGDTAERFGLFCARFAQAARWYHGQRFYLQRDMLRDARRAGLRALGINATAADLRELDKIWMQVMAERMRPRPEAYDALERIRAAGLRIGVISNSDCDEFAQDLAGTRFPELADVLLCSEEAGSCKPDPVIFYEALGRLKVRPTQAILVGTSIELDVRGAQLVGMRSVLLSDGSNQSWEQPLSAPDHVVSTLIEVATLVTLPAPAGGPRVRRRALSPSALASP